MAVTQEELKKLQADVAAAKKEYQAAEAAYKKFVAANGPSFKVGTPQYEEQLRLDKAVDKAVSQVRVAESAVLDAQQQETKQQAQQDGQQQQKEIAQQKLQDRPRIGPFEFTQDPGTGNWVATDTASGKKYYGDSPTGAANDAIRLNPNLLPSEKLSLQLKAKELTQSQQNTAQSAGEEVKQSGDAGVTNPPQPNQVLEPDGRINRNDLPGAGSNADTPKTTDTAAEHKRSIPHQVKDHNFLIPVASRPTKATMHDQHPITDQV